MVKAKILVVEDERVVALSIQNRLESLGYTVTANVISAEAAIAGIPQNPPDLVLMDIRLKGKIDGIEAAAQMRQQFQLPVVYLTAYNDEETLERAKFTEPYGYLLKPFESKDLSTTIEVALYKHKMEQQLREREQWLATTLKSIGDAVITTDPQRAITFMNPVAEALTKWTQQDALGQDLNQIFLTINETTREAIPNPVTVSLQTGKTVTIENHTLLIDKEGEEIPIDDSAAPIKNDSEQILGAVLVFHDVIEQRKIQALLKRTNADLEQRVAESTAQLRQQNQQLEAEIARRQQLEEELRVALARERELSQLKSRIVATVSHEYRTPLTTILSSTEMLQRYSDRLTPKKKQTHFQRVKQSVEHLTNLVNDMIFIEQAETQALEFNPTLVNVEELVGEVIEAVRPKSAGKHTLNLICPSECDRVLDGNLLRLILDNLLSNAIKYSPEGGLIEVEISHQAQEIRLRVSDEGIGIPPDDQGKLFKAFYRASNIGITPGVGLGLVIVKECVELHQGRVEVESEVGAGTTFTIILPVAESVEDERVLP
jgi:PAS domain S-box-containing protein